MDNRSSLQETKHHGEVRFPFNEFVGIYKELQLGNGGSWRSN